MPFLDLLLTIGGWALVAAVVFGIPAWMYLQMRSERRPIDKGRPPRSGGRSATGGAAAAMSLQEVTAMLKEGASRRSAFGNTVKFSTDRGVIFIDGKQTPPSVSNDDKAADCTLKMAFNDFVALISGELDGMSAYMTGKLKIEGDLGVAMKLRDILR
jgi:putative sterol carrier protein